MGYHRAGFDVTGVDLHPQPRYPFRFWQMNALGLELWVLSAFDAIHASPPCQYYSSAGKAAIVTYGERHYMDLYAATRGLLEASRRPWVIENVPAAPSRSGVLLCGSMFGLPIERHRIFESSMLILNPYACDHQPDAITITGHTPQRWLGGKRQGVLRETHQAAMGIDWMTVRELVQAVPPAYTEFVGRELMWSMRWNEAAQKIAAGAGGLRPDRRRAT